jgi:hypothetical protein
MWFDGQTLASPFARQVAPHSQISFLTSTRAVSAMPALAANFYDREKTHFDGIGLIGHPFPPRPIGSSGH